ncbi:small subunit of terminase [Levilactobacillus brevis]|uniref:phage terminase small subunit n=1 Tax=Levilactobacillus brevis TaxID=1580 RepID=UPI0021A74196|nr:phage terminase small subunit [Levilactobacillus brevis]MCT3567648.1 small subunit of terminase [Levilactobacillus brevis]
MARARNPKREQAKKKWLNSNGEKHLTDIAKELGLTPSQVRKWKSLDKWSTDLKENVTNDQKERYHSAHHNRNAEGNDGGAPPGNKNGVGYGAPRGNKNALVTGEYETIDFAYLSNEERRLFEGVTDDPLITINTQIRELKIRRYRILGRMQALNEAESAESSRFINTYINRKGAEKVSGWSTTEVRKFDDMLKLEEALNDVDASLLKANQQKQHMVEVGTATRNDDLDEGNGYFDALQQGIKLHGIPNTSEEDENGDEETEQN